MLTNFGHSFERIFTLKKSLSIVLWILYVLPFHLKNTSPLSSKPDFHFFETYLICILIQCNHFAIANILHIIKKTLRIKGSFKSSA